MCVFMCAYTQSIVSSKSLHMVSACSRLKCVPSVSHRPKYVSTSSFSKNTGTDPQAKLRSFADVYPKPLAAPRKI
jgi:hypothetical protein